MLQFLEFSRIKSLAKLEASTGDVLYKKVLLRKIHRKTPVPESLF